MLGQDCDRGSDRIADCFGTVPSECWTVLEPRFTVSSHARQVEQYCEPSSPFHKSPNCRTAESEDEITFPVAGNRSVGRLRWTLADHDLRRNEALAPCAYSGPWDSKCTPGPKAGGQFPAQRTPSLNVECLVDRLV
jgi:hypothetical protein